MLICTIMVVPSCVMGQASEAGRQQEVSPDSTGNSNEVSPIVYPIDGRPCFHVEPHLALSRHFLFRHDLSAQDAEALIGRAEDTYAAVSRLARTLGVEVKASASLLQVMIFSDRGKYETFWKGLGMMEVVGPGLYHESSNVAAFRHILTEPGLKQIDERIRALQAQSIKRRDGSGAEDVQSGVRITELEERVAELRRQRDHLFAVFHRMVLAHEIAHQVCFNIGLLQRDVDYPFWLVEGLACYFESAEEEAVVNEGVIAGRRLNTARFADLLEGLKISEAGETDIQKAWARATEADRFLTLRELVSGGCDMEASSDQQFFLYAQFWAWFDFLYTYHRVALAGLIEALEQRDPEDEVSANDELRLFEHFFGAIDGALKNQWFQYLTKLETEN